MKEFNLELVTPAKPLFKGEVTSVVFPGSKGEFQVLFNHSPIISTLVPGRIIVRQSDIDTLYSTSGGIVEIKDNKVTALLDSLEKAEEIDIVRATKSAERAKERLSSASRETINVARAEASLSRALVRIKVAGER
ncbi:MAG: ATP synthase F1 subunit epsilon [Ignavibacteriaceae bacterium]